MKSFIVAVALILSLLMGAPGMAHAQEEPALEKGMKPFGSYQGGDVDTINLSNGNLLFSVPLIGYSQRGEELRLNDILLYNNKGYKLDETCDSVGVCTRFWEFNGMGVSLIDDQSDELEGRVVNLNAGGDPLNPEWVTFYSDISADGSTHQMGYFDQGHKLRALDASGIMADLLGTQAVVDRKGNRHLDWFDGVLGHSLRQDTNGNQIHYMTPAHGPATVIDTVGRSLPGIWTSFEVPDGRLGTPTNDFSSCMGPLPIASAYLAAMPSFGGGVASYKFCYATVHLTSNFQHGDTSEFAIHDVGGPILMLQSVVLPNGTAWTFEYNSRDPGDTPDVNYADLTKISFPTGGTLSYTWATQTICNSVSRAVGTRTLDANDGDGPHTWTYSYAPESATTTVTDPNGNDTVHAFTYLGGIGIDGVCSSYETGTQYFQGSRSGGALLKSVETGYSFSPPSSNPSDIRIAFNVLKTDQKTILGDGKTDLEQYAYDSAGRYHWFYDQVVSLGTRKSVIQYDYGQGAPGALLRQTNTFYQFEVDANYLTANLLELPASVQVLDGAGNQAASTVYGYDDPARLLASGMGTQHGPPPSSARGNLSSQSKWLNTSGSYLTNFVNSFDTGMPYQSIDPMGQATTFAYSANLGGGYVTQTQLPDTGLSRHIVSADYDFNSGLITSFTDQNGNVSNYGYDNLGRITSARFPDTDNLGNRGETDFSYYDGSNIVIRNERIDANHCERYVNHILS